MDDKARIAELGEQLEAAQVRIRDLEMSLGLHRNDLAMHFKISPQQGKILALLLAVPNVTPDVLEQRLNIVATAARIAMHRLRSVLRGHGIEIHNKRSLGYWIDAETKARVHAMVTPAVTDDPPPDAGAEIVEFPATDREEAA